ncbi:YobI family P-loop NTPase [Chryseobacterium geocarposphaerae]|uniref:YobI-like P-loop NTPase domain-containing protein n=1 Tax=Chryseobacterium geocarposphaerae TaxID=1416776 RepID=A0A2M9CBC9_9FLAO|nr:hypothetical protein [Chryseobacterium geocarposphaerae]PJJ68149.1 hypothetical protein CLV73_2184 [Chryseobacterium geocarposphaerae]
MKKLLNEIRERYLEFKILSTEFYLNLLSGAILFLGRKKMKLLVKNNDNPNNLEDLTPYILKDEESNYNLQTYLNSLKWGVLNNNVRNIAISGSFGTGKSTILNLFKKNNPEFKILDINLGKFEEKNKQTEVDIETSIVQQILYYEKKKNLKDSRFERITFDRFIFIKVVFFIIWALSILYLFFDKIYQKLYLINREESFYYVYLMKFSFLLGVFFILKKIFKQLFKLKVNKVSFSDAEFVPKDNDISIINKHVDELIYFFEKTRTQIVFIEDIDRFEDAVEVFIKLRELNIIINNSKDIVQKVTFIYAVKDELFSKNNEKTKFFDLIIPVIPVVDYSNSNTQFIKRLKDDFINEDIISEDIINDISPYVNDMRSLINIINEFKTYYKIKSKENQALNGNKLFSLIVIKNMYPIEFKSLQNKEGIIYKIFELKSIFYSDIVKQIKKDIELLEEDNSNIELERQSSLIELQMIYLSQLLLDSFGAIRYNIDEDSLQVQDLIKEEKFEQFVNKGTLSYTLGGRTTFLSFANIETKVNPDAGYIDRKKRIEDKLNNKKQSNNFEIRKLRKRINKLKNSSLNQLFQKADRKHIEEYFTKAFVDANDKIELGDGLSIENNIANEHRKYSLLKVIITNNYLDENYSNYISLFYPESISENDYNLKLKIIEDGETAFNDVINKPKNLISELSIANFKKESILNFYILDYLLGNFKNNEVLTHKLEEFLNTISNTNDKSVDFIDKYIEYSEISGYTHTFILKISSWEDFWYLVHNEDIFSLKKKKKIIDILFRVNNIDEIKSLNKENKIKEFLEDYDDFLLNNYNENRKEEIFNKLKSLGIKFKEIKYEASLHDWILQVMNNNLYVIDINNINLFLAKYSNPDYIQYSYSTNNYTALLNSDCIALKENVSDNINYYVENVLLKLDNNNEEEIEVVETLLNNDEITISNRTALIRKIDFTVQKITNIDTELWVPLFINNRILPHWINILSYYNYNNKEIDFVIEEFLNKEENYNRLKLICINDSIDENENHLTDELITNFNISLINSEISNDAFDELIDSLTVNFDETSVIEKTERIPKLISNGNIILNSENLSSLSEIEIIAICEKKEVELNETYSNLELPIDSWKAIFMANINPELKLLIFDFLTDNEMYNSEDTSFLEVLINIFKENKFHQYSEFFVDSVMESQLIISDKIFLLNFEKDSIDTLQFRKYIEQLGKPFSLILQKEKIEIDNSDENKVFLENLRELGFIKRIYMKNNNSILTASYND